jgi:hypothetical protein
MFNEFPPMKAKENPKCCAAPPQSVRIKHLSDSFKALEEGFLINQDQKLEVFVENSFAMKRL